MHFSKTTEYAIRVLSYLYRFDKKPHSVAFLHKELNLPYKYLTKLMTELEKKELVSSLRGRDGGFTLKREASTIFLVDILEASGEPLESSRCILGFAECNAKNPCALHDEWLKPKKIMEEMLQNTSLASLIDTKETKI
mgnify:CR=1 FL=1